MRGWVPFLAGMVAGGLLALAAVGAAATRLAGEGLTARVDAAAIARDVRPAIELQVAKVISGVIDDMKRETPSRVAEELTRLLRGSGITIYGVEIHLPEESMREVQRQIEGVVARELVRSLDAVDVAGSARYWGEQGERMLAESLRRYLQGRTFTVEVGAPEPWFALPVTISLERR